MIPPRFAVGDYVNASYEGRYELGIVTQLHYSHPLVFDGEVLPYQIRLLGTNRLICARLDQDSMVRRAAPPVVTPPRFRYGDRVQVKFDGDGTWTDAWITQLWYTQPADSLATVHTEGRGHGEIIIMAPYGPTCRSHRRGESSALHSHRRRQHDPPCGQEPPRPALRFVVGTGVECFTNGGWARGVSCASGTRTWRRTCAKATEYRPELPEGGASCCAPPTRLPSRMGLIYAPCDDDGTIRPLSQPPPSEASSEAAPPAPPAVTTLPLPPQPPQPQRPPWQIRRPLPRPPPPLPLPAYRQDGRQLRLWPPRRQRGDELRQAVARRSAGCKDYVRD